MAEAYRNRRVSLPQKPSLESFLRQKPRSADVSSSNYIQKSTDEMKLDEMKGDETRKRSSSAKSFADDSLEMFLAQKLKSQIITNNPKAKAPDDLGKWCAEFDKILRIDKRSLDDVEMVMAFSQSDAFWKSNILSPAKLRQQFDRLYLQAKTPRNKASPAVRTEPQAWGKLS